MKKNESQPGLANDPARPAHFETAPPQQDGADLNTNGSATLATLLALSEIARKIGERCGGVLAEMSHDIRCLRAARGGTSGTSQTAAAHLAHHDLKSVPLEDAHLAKSVALARAEAELASLLTQTLEKQLEVEIYRNDLSRCEAAMERQKERRAVYKEFRVLAQARSVVARLADHGIMEGHWSTVTHQTLNRIADLLREDNVAAGVGSPDNPRMDWKKGAR